ncbi:MAG TPA: hypothetical protein DCZ95_00435, partial [Verrucomicrobia bacterium]|nr:hypothetical protein [Verrucomicrobiota bacterium]
YLCEKCGLDGKKNIQEFNAKIAKAVQKEILVPVGVATPCGDSVFPNSAIRLRSEDGATPDRSEIGIRQSLLNPFVRRE